MSYAGGQAHAWAIDLPGVGASAGLATDGSKSQLAAIVHDLIGTLGLTDVTLVGHDIGGMVTYRYLRDYHDISRSCEIIHNPVRVITDGSGCEVVFTLRRLPGMSEKDFERDADAVSADLTKLKRVLEGASHSE